MITGAEREHLARQWAALWKRLGIPAERAPALDPLLDRYESPSRHYHDARHLIQCLNELDRERASCVDPDSVEAALWFHDAIYDATQANNEEQSADLARITLIATGAAQEFVEKVSLLILATKHARPPSGADSQIIVDVDLSILGQSPPIFDAYEVAIRTEYAHVPEPAFRAGRSKVLQQFLDRPTIFSTRRMQDRYEIAARENIQRSIARLEIG